MISVVDYNMGNIGSIVNILRYVGCTDVKVTTSKEDIDKADKLILPGVGAFDEGIRALKRQGLFEAIREAAETRKIPIMGICLGMQLLGISSEEGKEEGFGLIPFSCKKFSVDGLKVPHMGWDYVEVKNGDTRLTRDVPRVQRYYFVHSYHAVCTDERNVLMTCDYGETFPAAVYSENVYGFQFHPEKSHQFGKRIFMNFVGMES